MELWLLLSNHLFDIIVLQIHLIWSPWTCRVSDQHHYLQLLCFVSGRILQVIYGHFDVVTCICRSEVNMMHDCFIVTGSKDCTCMIWQWIGQKQRIYSDQLSVWCFLLLLPSLSQANSLELSSVYQQE